MAAKPESYFRGADHALFGLGELLREANHLNNPPEVRVAVKVRAQDIRPGSFEIGIELWQSFPDELKNLLTEQSFKTAKEILGIVGLGGGGTFGLIQLIKWLRSKKEKKPSRIERKEGDTFQVIAQDGSSVIINQGTLELSQSSTALFSLERAYSPLRQPGIERLDVERGKKTREPVETVTKDDLEYFELEDEESKVTTLVVPETTTQKIVEVIRPSFSGSLRWTLGEGEGGGSFQAVMKDPRFTAAVDANKSRFGSGDLLHINLRSMTRLTEGGQLRTDHEITDVIRHIKSPRGQLRLTAGETAPEEEPEED